jgi:hypothetical protein
MDTDLLFVHERVRENADRPDEMLAAAHVASADPYAYLELYARHCTSIHAALTASGMAPPTAEHHVDHVLRCALDAIHDTASTGNFAGALASAIDNAVARGSMSAPRTPIGGV